MSLHEFSDEEISLVRKTYPGLNLIRRGVWQGLLEFDATFGEYRIQDSYKIEIYAPAGYPNRIPLLLEIGGRTQEIASKYDIQDLRTLHQNPKDGTACVCIRQEEKSRFPQGSNLVTFINDLVVPYLYGLSFFDENSRWSWREYSHGGLGLLEFYEEDLAEQVRENIEELVGHLRTEVNWKAYSKQVRKPSPDRQCFCGSKRPFQICHPEAWQGILRLHADIKRLNLNPRGLFQKPV